MRALRIASAVALALAVAAPAAALAQGHIVIVNNDGPGEGFNDPTTVAPVGGNPGLTRGQQRLNVFDRAAALWEAELRPTNDIFVLAQFTPLGPNVLGSAGTTFVFSDFPGAELPGTWYHSALADQLAGVELNPGQPDIVANFSSDFDFYLGFDNAEGPGQNDLLAVVLHELGHGLGFANFVNEVQGTLLAGSPDVYSQYTLDVDTNRIWNEMTIPERRASAINIRKVSWNGLNVNRVAADVLSPGEPFLGVVAPAGIGPLLFGTASFGPPLTTRGTTGDLVLANDGVGAPADACEPFAPSALLGRIALVDRGTCTFVVKVKNAQDAGAIAVVVADNVAGSPPPGLGGADPTITIPSGRVTLADGNRLKAALAAGAVRVTLGLDTSILAGTDRVQGLVLLATFDPVLPGSSISHYDSVAFRNLLMEPAINPDLTSSLRPPEDLTVPQMTDIGWFSDHDGVPDGADSCIGSDLRPTVIVGACDSEVSNASFANGCTITDLVTLCLDARNRGQAEKCVSGVVDVLKKTDVITGREGSEIRKCANRNRGPSRGPG